MWQLMMVYYSMPVVPEKGITIEDDVIISRNCVIQGKTATVSIGKNTDIGCNTILSSGGGSDWKF
ncbi:hypothetical protein [Acaryochloris sp. CCMEE 5410]|uniref:hypothetical protein n=1 Tax=Acaryochloris sp. CCMEE 5410 TaxID=310037 RepID=UPI0021CF8D49|nr:hypothetical protein [Acaryochloris sp. CCMEE 5410]KAI9133930.1 hypothetical protein ON05_011945 [Acaryochloris sp. CCMEE 5410]